MFGVSLGEDGDELNAELREMLRVQEGYSDERSPVWVEGGSMKFG